MSGPLPQDEFARIFSRVPRLTVELVIASSDRGVLLALRDLGPCEGLWHLPGGTVRFAEPVVEAVRRVARDELGLAFCATAAGDMPDERDLQSECAWFTLLPDNMHDEQKEFLVRHLDIVSSGPTEER